MLGRIWYNLSMNFNDIQSEYKQLLENLSLSHAGFENVISEIKKFLQEYSNSEEYNENLAYELDVNLICLETIFNQFSELLEEFNPNTIEKMKFPEKKKAKKGISCENIILLCPNGFKRENWHF